MGQDLLLPHPPWARISSFAFVAELVSDGFNSPVHQQRIGNHGHGGATEELKNKCGKTNHVTSLLE